MPMWVYFLCFVLGYLLGNVQFAVIFSKLLHHDDVRNHGSGNAGSTNMLRVFGPKAGAFTFIGDFAKGAVAVLLGRLIAGEIGGYVMAVGTVMGHCFPALLGFKGGKGVASTYGIICVIAPLYAAIITGVCLIILFVTRTISIVSLSGATLLVGLTLGFSRDNMPLIMMSIILWLIVVLRHADNIHRLAKGEESKVFQKKGKEEEEKK